jgi:uncharacterized membrane protein
MTAIRLAGPGFVPGPFFWLSHALASLRRAAGVCWLPSMHDASVSIMGRMSSGCLRVRAFHFVWVDIGWRHACRVLLCGLEPSARRRSRPWFRLFDEASVLLFAAPLVLVVVSPF